MGYLIFAYKIALVVSREYQENDGTTLSIRNNCIEIIFDISDLCAKI